MKNVVYTYILAVMLVPSLSIAQTSDELKEMMALMINMNGHLCAEITDVRPLHLEDTYEVTCIEYRGGRKTVEYLFAIRGDGIIVEKR